MNDKFEKFTSRARTVLSLAQEEAQRLNHNYIGTEHLLLGLIREGDGVAAKVLANLGVSLPEVRQKVEEITGRGDRIVLGDIGLTPRAKKVVELAVDESRRLNHHYIGTEHLLLGLIREGEGIAAGVLESLGVSLEQVKTQTIQILGPSNPYHAPESPWQASPPGGTFAFAPRASYMRSSAQVNVDFGGLDEGAQHVMLLAQAEAQYLHRIAVGDDHILLGLVLEGTSSAACALDQHGATIFALRRVLVRISDFDDDSQTGQIGLTPHATMIIMRAANDSHEHGAPLITPEHLLLALLAGPKGPAIAALRQLGIDLEALHAEVSQHTRDGRQADHPPE